MIDKRTMAILFAALLICDAMGAHSKSSQIQKSKSLSTPESNFRGDLNKHIAILDKTEVLATKKNKAMADPCGCNAPPITCSGSMTFHDTWETIGSCCRQWQTVKEVQTTVDTIKCEATKVDTLTNKKVGWSVLQQKNKNEKNC